MKVSIITVVYNNEKTIANAIESVLAQDYRDIEYIVIDGKSSDNTLAIIEKYSNKISKIISEKDNGIYDAMNKGIMAATGNIIGILNSDDLYIHKDTISNVVSLMSSANADVCYADLCYVSANDTNRIVRRWKAGNFTKRSFYYGWMPPHPTVFVKKTVYNKVGLFNLILKSAADYEMMLRIFFKSNFAIAYLPQTIIHMRTGGASNASLKNRIRANKEDRMAWKLNNIKPYFFTLMYKPFRKFFQYL